MSGDKKSLTSVFAAALVMIAGLLPAVWLLGADRNQDIDEYAEPLIETTVEQTISETVVDVPPELDVDGLSPAIVRVLQANGYAGLMSDGDFDEELPPAVTRVLIDHDVVLTVVEEDTSVEEGS